MRARIAGTSSQPATTMRGNQDMASVPQPRLADCKKALRLSFNAMPMSPSLGGDAGEQFTEKQRISYAALLGAQNPIPKERYLFKIPHIWEPVDCFTIDTFLWFRIMLLL